MKHETKVEWFKRSNSVVKTLYVLGCIKIRAEGASDYKRRYSIYIRRLHPISWIFFIAGFLIGGINRETINSFKDDTVWW